MKRKIIVLVLSLAILIVGAGGALASNLADPNNEKAIALGITEEQQIQIKEYFEEFRAKIVEIREKLRAARQEGNVEVFEEAATERIEARADMREKVESVLTEEQLEKKADICGIPEPKETNERRQQNKNTMEKSLQNKGNGNQVRGSQSF